MNSTGANKYSVFSTLTNLIRVFFWILIVVILLSGWFGNLSLQKKRLTVIEAIQKDRRSRVITLIHRQETISLLGIPVNSYIDIDDDEDILRAIRLTPPDMPIDLILHTPGGLVLAASQIAHAIQNHKGKVTVFIPHYAMSGGTLLALAANDIVMDPNAVMGPVDPQIGDYPAASIIKVVEDKPLEHIDDDTLILADISHKAINQITTLVYELFTKRMPQEQAKKLTELLTAGQFTHDYPITVERARELGVPISTDMPESIYRLMDLYPQEGKRRPSVNYVPLEKRS